MPARLVQVSLRNNTEFPMRWITDHLDRGGWQDPWYPSKLATLEPGQEGAWRSESDGILSGTEGWALFEVALPDEVSGGTRSEFARIYWYRPYFGFFDASWSVTRFDPRSPPTGSTFADTRESTTELDHRIVPLGSEDEWLGDAAFAVSGAVAGPVPLFVTGGLAVSADVSPGKHVGLKMQLRRRPARAGGPLVIRKPPEARMTAEPFAWVSPTMSCAYPDRGTGLLNEPAENWATAEASVLVENVGGGSLSIDGVLCTSPDPKLVFGPERIRIEYVTRDSYAVTVRTPGSDAYRADPYPCQLTIDTNGGSQTVDLGTVPPLDEEVLRIQVEAALASVERCNVTIEDWKKMARMPLEWLAESGPDDALRRWRVEVGGMPANSRFVVVNRVTDEEFPGVTGEDGVGYVTVFTDPAHGDALEVARTDDRLLEDADQAYISVAQTPFIPSGPLPADARLVSTDEASISEPDGRSTPLNDRVIRVRHDELLVPGRSRVV